MFGADGHVRGRQPSAGLADARVGGRQPSAGLADARVGGRQPSAGLADAHVGGRQPSAGLADEAEERSLVGETLLDRWRIVRLLGRGGMSMVYEAEHRNGARVAIKVLNATLARNPRARGRFL